MSIAARRIVLASRPTGWPGPETFRMEDFSLPEPGDGEISVEVVYLSVDPYMRSRLRDAPSYAAPVGIGETMTGGGVGRVLASRNPRFAPGDWVEGITGWRSHLAADGKGFRKIDASLAPVSTALGVLGMPGLTAYFGVLDVGKAKEGETVLVSGAAGAVGSIAGQIAKIQGCRAVGIAGGEEKVRWISEDLGFDAAFDYKAESDYRGAIARTCPNGVDVHFDNVGGPIGDAVFPNLNVGARVAVCGQISQYNDEKPEPGPRLLWHLIVKRARVEGFLVIDYAARFREGRERLAQWLREGKLRYREDVEHGLENAPRAFIEMMRGRNMGKMLVKIADE